MATMLLILIGDGVCGNVLLTKSAMQGGGPIIITVGWGLALMIPAYMFGPITGAHVNPAVSIALAIDGTIPFSVLPLYLIGQFAGAFVGACIVYLLYMKHFDVTQDQNLKRSVFCTSPAIADNKTNFLSEVVGTFVLMFAIKGLCEVPALKDSGLLYMFIGLILVSVGMSFGGLTAYAVNPARDLGPRLAFTVLPIKDKGSAHWKYAWIPCFGPIIGAIIAVLVFAAIPWL